MMRKKYFLREADEMSKEEMLKSLEDSLKQDNINLEKNRESLEVNKNTLKASEIDVTTKNQQIQANDKVKTSGLKADEFTDPNTTAQSIQKQKPVLTKQVNALKLQNKEKELSIKNQEKSIEGQEDYIEQKEDYIKDMESSMRESRIIKAKDFKSIVENYSKIDLSESDIINIIV